MVSRKDFVTFLDAAQTDDKLVRDFCSKNTAEELYLLFRERFPDISEKDWAEILQIRIRLEGMRFPGLGNIPLHGKDPCPDERKGY